MRIWTTIFATLAVAGQPDLAASAAPGDPANGKRLAVLVVRILSSRLGRTGDGHDRGAALCDHSAEIARGGCRAGSIPGRPAPSDAEAQSFTRHEIRDLVAYIASLRQ